MSDQLPDQSKRTIVSSGWFRRPPVAACDVPTCGWEHKGVTLVATRNEADDHVLRTGHAVTITATERMTVAPLRGGA